MLFGEIINNGFVRKQEPYQHHTDTDISARDRSDVALSMKPTFYPLALEHGQRIAQQANQHNMLVGYIYNATGDQIVLYDQHSAIGAHRVPLNAIIENGQWSVFLHTRPFMTPLGTQGCLVYRASPESSNTDFYFGWRIPLIGVNSTWCEAQSRDHWWTVASKADMDHHLNLKFTQSTEHEHIRNGFKITCTMARGSVAELTVVITKVWYPNV